MKGKPSIEKLLEYFIKKLSTVAGVIVLITTLLGAAFYAGIYYQSIVLTREISDINNKHTLEIIELKKQMIELNQQNFKLSIQNEKRK